MNSAAVRDDVDSCAAFDGAQVAGGFFINPSIGAGGDGQTCHGDGTGSLFRAHAGVGSYAVADEVQGVFGRAGVEDGARRAVGVQSVAEVDVLDVFFSMFREPKRPISSCTVKMTVIFPWGI